MAELFVRRPKVHHHLIAIVVLAAMLVLMTLLLQSDRAVPGGH